jgi:LPS-assembly lipoprotein
MWWSESNTSSPTRAQRALLALAVALPLVLAACGYTPVYAPTQSGPAIQGRIAFADPSGPDEFLLLQQLERRMGRAASATHQLDYTTSVRSDALAISVAGARTRYNILAQVNYALVEKESGITVLSGSVQDFASYSAAGTTIATFAAEQDARERLMIALGDQLTNRLLLADLS